jgi:stringent starvation protein B
MKEILSELKPYGLKDAVNWLLYQHKLTPELIVKFRLVI